jgi:dTDP-4-dehydrorhamnose reductase
MQRSKILVTGSNGQLGKEFSVLAQTLPQYEFIFLSKEDLDIHRISSVENAFAAFHPQYCLNCAAYTAVDKAESEKDLAYLVNAEAPGILAAVCKKYNTRFIHFSTDYVFDGTSVIPYKEDDPANPQSVYGYSKLEGERKVMEHNNESIIIRTSWVYSRFGKNFVKTMLKLMSEKEEINVVSDQVGSPTYAADLADAVMQIIDSGQSSTINWQPGIYHYSNDGVISWYDFAVTIKEISGSNCKVNPIPSSEYPTPAKRPAYSVFDKKKIRQVLGIKTKPWKESLKTCIWQIRNAE